MNILEILKSAKGEANITLSVTPEDLKEFALCVLKEYSAMEKSRNDKHESDQEDKMFTISEVSKYLSVSKSTLWRWNKMGILKPHTKIGSHPMYSVAEVCKSFKINLLNV